MAADVESVDAAPPPADHERIEEADDDDAEHEVDDLADPKPKKKRRIVKVSDKKYECPEPDCGKAYSRAEHLYRHQLNHTPKQIYRCDFPGCDRHFVRADLCARHRERHNAKGSHLQRKYALLSNQRSAAASGESPPPASATVDVNQVFNSSSTSDGYMQMAEPLQPCVSESNPVQNSMVEMAPLSTSNQDHQLGPYGAYPVTVNGAQQSSIPYAAPVDSQRFNYDTSFSTRQNPQITNSNQYPTVTINSMQPPPTSSPQSTGTLYAQQTYPSPTSTGRNFRSPSNLSSLPSLPPFGVPQGYGTHGNSRSVSTTSPAINSMEQYSLSNSRSNSLLDFGMFDQATPSYSMPVFGGDDTTMFGRSPPPSVDENFLNMLLSANGVEMNDPSPQEPEPTHISPTPNGVSLPKLARDGAPSEQRLPSLSDGMDINIPESMLSEKKQRRLFDLVQGFEEVEHECGRMKKADIMAGNPNDPTHPMSLRMLKTYLSSYWLHIHQQMPILHRPTFNAETCPDLLLLAMVCLGATCLERIHPMELSKTSAELAFFAAYHIRWEVFKDAEFRPTAKLWTFQSMLLLELFEKMYSTRCLHERAHIHHATTLTVMRRGSSLIGRSAFDYQKGADDPTRTPPGPEGTINTSGQNTRDAYWNRWITAEATRRAAFAAFILDSTHATLFGHSAVMSPHELRLPLPCDEALWSATSSAEVQRVEASLSANGFKPTSFLDGLRRTLNGQRVRTNTFGRVILMAGLLNVSWHMNQRDLQVSSLGATNTLGNQTKWRSPLTRAFDHWRRDFDESLSKTNHPTTTTAAARDLHVLESRTCLHSLAHMAMHVDIIDCQVFAGADRALGRLVTDSDRAAVQARMRHHWAPSARARDATFYALRFLAAVLLPPTSYSARDDYLLNRPWILHFAALITFIYGYALDGPLHPTSSSIDNPAAEADMRNFLLRMTRHASSPDDLQNLSGRNGCLGLLVVLRERFREPRWELLHEAAGALEGCIGLLVPGGRA